MISIILGSLHFCFSVVDLYVAALFCLNDKTISRGGTRIKDILAYVLSLEVTCQNLQKTAFIWAP